jgi:hypothetical protein
VNPGPLLLDDDRKVLLQAWLTDFIPALEIPRTRLDRPAFIAEAGKDK